MTPQSPFQLGGQVVGEERREHGGHDEGFAIHASFRVELREFYVHDAAWAQPGGGGYAISMSAGSSRGPDRERHLGPCQQGACHALRRRWLGGRLQLHGHGYINTQGYWIETGLNASHMVGPHHVLFEGNYGHNADSDIPTATASISPSSAIICAVSGRRSTTRRAAASTTRLNPATGRARRRADGLFLRNSFVGNVLGAAR